MRSFALCIILRYVLSYNHILPSININKTLEELRHGSCILDNLTSSFAIRVNFSILDDPRSVLVYFNLFGVFLP